MGSCRERERDDREIIPIDDEIIPRDDEMTRPREKKKKKKCSFFSQHNKQPSNKQAKRNSVSPFFFIPFPQEGRLRVVKS